MDHHLDEGQKPINRICFCFFNIKVELELPEAVTTRILFVP